VCQILSKSANVCRKYGVEGTSVTLMIAGTVIGTLALTTVVIVVVALVQRRNGEREQRRQIEHQIRLDLFRSLGQEGHALAQRRDAVLL